MRDKSQSTSCKASKMQTSDLEKNEEEGDSTSPLDYLKTQEFKEIAVNVRQSMKHQLEEEGVLNNISNGELRDRICKRLIYVTGFEEESKDHIDRVIFMSDPEQSTKDVKTDPEKDAPIDNSKKQETDSDGSMDKWGEERDIMVFIDDDNHEFLKGLSDVNRLKIFDAVNKLPKFRGYQPKSSSESFSDIVIKSVGLMCLLNIKKKLPAKEVEEFEDLVTDFCVEVKHQEWIQKSRKCGARLPQIPKDGHDVREIDGNPIKGGGGTSKVCERDEKLDNSDAGTATYGDILEGDGKPEEPVVSQGTSPSCSTLGGDVHKDDEFPSHSLCKNDNVIQVNKLFKHDALHDTVVGALENTGKTKASLSPAAFSEDDGSHQVDYGDLIEQIKLDNEE